MNCLIVYGLEEKTNQKEIEELFLQFGRLHKIEIWAHEYTDQTRGFAFVYFAESMDAKLAQASLNGTEIDERKIVVDFPFRLWKKRTTKILRRAIILEPTNTKDTHNQSLANNKLVTRLTKSGGF